MQELSQSGLPQLTQNIYSGVGKGILRHFHTIFKGDKFPPLPHLDPEIKSKHPTMTEKEFFHLSLGQKRGFSYFVLHTERRHRGPEVTTSDLYW